MRYSYRRWDGTQQLAPFDADELLDALSDELIADGDVERALRRLLREGDRGRLEDRLPGLRELLERARQRRREQLQRYNMDSTVEEIARELAAIVDQERAGIDRRVADSSARLEQARDTAAGGNPPAEPGEPAEEAAAGPSRDPSATPEPPLDAATAAQFHEMLEQLAGRKQRALDELPPDVAGRIERLRDYEFMDPEARARFEALVAALEQQMMQSIFQGMQQTVQQMTSQDLDRVREMVRDLNAMLRQRQEGIEPDFQAFMAKHGQFFPGVESLDQLLNQLAQQQAAMASLLNSMSPAQRQQLENALNQLLRDDRLRADLAQLAANLDRMMPGQSPAYPFSGSESLSLQEATRVIRELQGLDTLERQLRQAQYGQIENVDSDLARQLVGNETAEDLRRLQDLARMLEEAGFVDRQGGRLEMTPRGMRKIGQQALRDIFSQLQRDGGGNHPTHFHGATGDRTDDTKRYEFGDPFQLNLRDTLMNAVRRQGVGTPLRLTPDDFQVYESELATHTATVIMVDMSRSMLLRGCFFAAKKVTLALDSLIRGQFPRDSLHVVGFSYQARELRPSALPGLDWDEHEYGTNMQHGLMLSRRLLAKQKSANKQIIMITDGEPTAHLEGDRVDFNYPPTYRTIRETLKEVVRCTKDGIVINTFMLERGDALSGFIDQVTEINRGRAFFAEPERLGEFVLVDYVDRKRRTRRMR